MKRASIDLGVIWSRAASKAIYMSYTTVHPGRCLVRSAIDLRYFPAAIEACLLACTARNTAVTGHVRRGRRL